MKRAVELLLDSGAYSAWTTNAPIKVKDYIKFVRQFEKYLWGYINLDVIPGRYMQKRSESEVEKAALESYKNLQAMKDVGLKPIPVFHRGEAWSHLERLLKDGETYIGLSPLVDSREAEKATWLDECFSILCNREGKPFVKTHGFGVTNPAWMIRYPWYSVDSTSWVKNGGFGNLLIPTMGKNGPKWDELPKRIHISDVIQKNNKGFALHSTGPNERRYLTDLIEELGFNMHELYHSRYARCALVLHCFNMMAKQPRRPFRHFVRRLIKSFKYDGTPIADGGFYLFHSTNVSNDQGSLLTRGKSPYRLLSYYELRDYQPEKIQQYVIDGMVDLDYTREQPPVNWESLRYTSWRRVKLLERINANQADRAIGQTE